MTDISKLHRKDLKGPDEFITAFKSTVAWVRLNQSLVLGVIAAVILVGAAASGTRSYFAWQEAKANKDLWPHLNRAREILQAPGKADIEKLVGIEQFLSAYVNQHPKTQAGVYAHYYLGSIAFTRRDFGLSIAQFKATIDQGKDIGVMRFLARQGLAQALEAKGDYASASTAFKDAASAATGDLKFQALLGEARVLTQLGRNGDAVAIYREIAAGNPAPSTKEFVEIKLARIQ